MVTPKTSRQRRSLSKTRGRHRALSESSLGARGWGKTCRKAECQKFHTHLETQAPVCGSHQSKTQSLSSSTVYTSWIGLWSKNGLKYSNDLKTATFISKVYRELLRPTLPADNSQGGLRTTVKAACGQQSRLACGQQSRRPAHNTALRLRGASK